MTQVKRNMIQVRLNDAQFKAFNSIKKSLGANNNAETIRMLINDKELVGKANHDEITAINQKYDDLTAKINALFWNSSNIAKNMNEIAHASNIAKDSDPGNTETWNWIINQLQKMIPAIQQTQQSANAVKAFLHESRVASGNTHF